MKTFTKLRAGLAIASSVVTSTAIASTYTASAPTNDAMIFASSSGADTGKASGKGPGMFAGADTSGNIKRSLVKFDITAIPTSKTVDSVELDLYIGQIAGSGGQGGGCGTNCTPASRTFSIYQVDYTHSWSEGNTGITGCPMSGPSQFTTECASINGTGQGWTYASCSGTGVDGGCGNDVSWADYLYDTSAHAWGNSPSNQDYGTGSFGSPNFGNHTAAGSWTFNNFLNNHVMAFTSDTGTNNPSFTAVVQDWVTTPSHNNGMEIRAASLEGTATSFIGWWTKDGASASGNGLNPSLTVTYH
jgi:hypothetical protein